MIKLNLIYYLCSIERKKGIIGGGMYQKLVIKEADTHMRVFIQMICSDWPTILKCSTIFG